MKTEMKLLKEQEKQIQEMEHYISALEEENKLQKELIEMLTRQNAALQHNYEEYVEMVHRMMKDFKS